MSLQCLAIHDRILAWFRLISRMPQVTKPRLFLLLFIAGMIGVLSFLLVDLAALISLIPVRPGTPVPAITPLLKFGSLIQPSLLLALAVLLGVVLAPKVQLSAPVAEAIVGRLPIAARFKPQIVPGIIGGAIGATFVVSLSAVLRPFLAPDIIERTEKLAKLLPLTTRLLYGGVTEELLLRWGFMTLVVWLGWRFLQKQNGTPTRGVVAGSILVSSLVFAAGHLPLAFMVIPEPTLVIVVFVIVANSVFGLICGYLYWKRGLESAMIAHMVGHIFMFTATYFGL